MSEPRKGPRQRGNESTLAKARMARGLTQGQLAEAVGCYGKDISRWERGERTPSANSLRALAKARDCTIDDLLSDE